MKVLVLGSAGMLGQAVLSDGLGTETVGYDRDTVDITDLIQLQRVVETERPTHIINCAAYTAVDAAESDQVTCWKLNVVGIQNIVFVCRLFDVKLIQLSTDYVFSGSCQSYREADVLQPINYYGFTKAVGEQIVATLPKYAIVRTAWLYGQGGKNFVDTIAQRLRSGASLKVVDDQFGSPTSTVDLAAALREVLDASPGVYHLTNGGSGSWYELACAIADHLGYSSSAVERVSSAEYTQTATRPHHSVLENTKLAALRPWPEALQAYLKTE